MKARQPYHLSWQLLTAVIIIGFVIFVEYWPHVTDNTLMGGALVSGGLCIGTYIRHINQPTTKKSNV